MGNSIKRKIYKLRHPRPKRNKYFDLKEGEVNKVKLNSKFNVNWVTNYTVHPKYWEKFYYSSTQNKNVEYIDSTSIYLGDDDVCGANTLVQFTFKAVKKGKDTIYFINEPYENDNIEKDLEGYTIDNEFRSHDDNNKNENKINSENINDNQEHEDNKNDINDNNINEEKKNNDNENIDLSQQIKYEVEII